MQGQINKLTFWGFRVSHWGFPQGGGGPLHRRLSPDIAGVRWVQGGCTVDARGCFSAGMVRARRQSVTSCASWTDFVEMCAVPNMITWDGRGPRGMHSRGRPRCAAQAGRTYNAPPDHRAGEHAQGRARHAAQTQHRHSTDAAQTQHRHIIDTVHTQPCVPLFRFLLPPSPFQTDEVACGVGAYFGSVSSFG